MYLSAEILCPVDYKEFISPITPLLASLDKTDE